MKDVGALLEAALVGRTVAVSRREHDWDFNCGDGLGVAISAPWRLTDATAILVTSDDHDQIFGLPEPIDAGRRANEVLGSHIIEGVDADTATGDLRIRFIGGLRLEVFNNSSGYEAWQAVLALKGSPTTIVALGGGDFALSEPAVGLADAPRGA